MSNDALMIATGWHNGQPRNSGSGSGLRLSRADRDKYMLAACRAIVLAFPDEFQARVRLCDAFSRNCFELRSAAIGRWLVANDLASW
jgi:hypothetical protein